MKPKVYSEIYAILNMLGKEYIESISEEILRTIEDNKDENYNPLYTIDNITNQNISDDTISTITYFNIEFWNGITDKNDLITIIPEF